MVTIDRIESAIFEIRGHRVILDATLAALYGLSTKRLNQQRKRNPGRFPPDFAFQLTAEEVRLLRSQLATSNRGRGGRRYRPWAFTEHGAVMVANVLSSPRAIEVSVLVVRAFVRLRQFAISHAELAGRLDELERKYDARFKIVFSAIRALMQPPKRQGRQIGFPVGNRGNDK